MVVGWEGEYCLLTTYPTALGGHRGPLRIQLCGLPSNHEMLKLLPHTLANVSRWIHESVSTSLYAKGHLHAHGTLSNEPTGASRCTIRAAVSIFRNGK